jgi:hypothetical protein
MEELVDRKLAIQDSERAIGQLGPQILGQGDLAVAIGTEGHAGEQVAAQHHEGDQAQLRIAGGGLAAARAGATKFRVVLGAIRQAQRRAVDAQHRQGAPAVLGGRGRGPCVGAMLKEPGERLGPDAVARLHDRATADGLTLTITQGQHEVEVAHDLLDRAVAQ